MVVKPKGLSYGSAMKLIYTKEASKKFGVNVQRVRHLISDSRPPAQKVGRDWVIREMDLARVVDRKPGRPRKIRG